MGSGVWGGFVVTLSDVFSVVPAVNGVMNNLLSRLFARNGGAPLGGCAFQAKASITSRVSVMGRGKRLILGGEAPGPLYISFPTRGKGRNRMMVIRSYGTVPLGSEFGTYTTGSISAFGVASISKRDITGGTLFTKRGMLAVSTKKAIGIGRRRPGFVKICADILLARGSVAVERVSNGNGKRVMGLCVRTTDNGKAFRARRMTLSASGSIAVPRALVLAPSSRMRIDMALGCTAKGCTRCVGGGSRGCKVHEVDGRRVGVLRDIITIGRASGWLVDVTATERFGTWT